MSPTPTRARVLTLATLLALCLPATAQDSSSPEASFLAIRGTVINALTRDPIPRALITSNDNRIAALTDADGRFEFAIPNPVEGAASESSASHASENAAQGVVVEQFAQWIAPTLFTARKPGYLQGESVTATLDPSTHELVIALTPEAIIAGRVALPSAEPAAHIGVELYRRAVQEGRASWLPVGATTTRSGGDFRFAELSPGTYKIFTREMLDRDPQSFNPLEQLYGYPPVYFPGATDFAAADAIELTPGKTFQADLTLVRQPYYPVKIPVSNLAPGGTVNVSVSVQGHRGPGFSLGFNVRNQTIEGLLPGGNYTLGAIGVAPALASPAEPVSGGLAPTGVLFSSGAINVSVKGAPLDGVRMDMLPASSIRVTVKADFTAPQTSNAGDLGTASSVLVPDASAQPNPGAPSPGDYLNVQLRPADDFTAGRGTFLRPPAGPGDESLWLDNVLPGRYWVEVHANRGYVASLTSGSVDLLSNPLVVAQTASVPPIEAIVRDDAAHLEGTVETADLSSGESAEGAPQPAVLGPTAHIYCVPLADSPGQFVEILPSPDGHFSAPEMAPGSYRVLAFKHPNPQLEYRNPEAMRAYESEGVVVRLSPDGKEVVRLSVSEPKE